MEKLKLDVQKFKSLPSGKYHFGNSSGEYCAQGKILAASGIEYPKDTSIEAREEYGWACRDILWENRTASPNKLGTIGHLNNSGKFEEADALALEWAIESGKFELVNLVPDPVEETKKPTLARLRVGLQKDLKGLLVQGIYVRCGGYRSYVSREGCNKGI